MSNGEEPSAFAKAMRDVKPLEHEERATTQKRPRAVARQTRAAHQEILEESLHGPKDAATREALDALEQMGEEVAYRHPSLTTRTFRQLRRGRFAIEDEADLHGLTASEAKLVLREFIVESADRGLGCVRVIHGKGLRSGPAGPVLKTRVQRWLVQWDEVLAFVSAQRRHGGAGAVYVLLRRR